MASENSLVEELKALQKKLGKKQSFEAAVSSIQSILRNHYSSSSPALRNSVNPSLFLFILMQFRSENWNYYMIVLLKYL